MRKLIITGCVLSLLAGCSSGSSAGSEPAKDEKQPITFEVSIPHGSTFTYELNPEEAVSYQELRDSVITDSIDESCWKNYFDVREVYREHYERDEEGNPTDVYQAGLIQSIVLNDDYYYADNWSRNGLEWEVFVDGTETMTMTDRGETKAPLGGQVQETRTLSGADGMLILTDFTDSWGGGTVQKYEGQLNGYEMVSCSGDLKLLKTSALPFKKLQDNIWVLAAYESEEEFFVIFFETDADAIDRETEYLGAMVEADGHGGSEAYTGYEYFTPWVAVVELMRHVNGD